MHKNPWFMLVLGGLVGLAVGYVIGENQAVLPASAARQSAQGSEGALPQGHPPVPAGQETGGSAAARQQLERQVDDIRNLLEQNPDDARLMVALGNLYFDAGRWQDARLWYERALEREPGDPNVLTDLGVVYRNLDQPERALEHFDRAIAVDPDHGTAWYNKVVVFHYDLHQHERAEEALERLRRIQEGGGRVPDLSRLAADVLGG